MSNSDKVILKSIFKTGGIKMENLNKMLIRLLAGAILAFSMLSITGATEGRGVTLIIAL